MPRTWQELAGQLARWGVQLAPPCTPELAAESLVAVESLAETTPVHAALDRALVALHAAATAGAGLPARVSGVHRERLIRWDAWTTTWWGRHHGEAAMVRTLRGPWRGDPVAARRLMRIGRVLREAGVPVRSGDGALVLPLQGVPVAHGVTAPHRARVELGARLVGTVLHAATRWQAAGIGWPALCEEELRLTDGAAWVQTLSWFPASHAAVAPARAAAVHAVWPDPQDAAAPPADDALSETWQALVQASPEDAEDAAQRWRSAMADHLAAARHRLAQRHDTLATGDRRGRLQQALHRLQRAMPLPHRGDGCAVLGVDLEGLPVIAEVSGGTLTARAGDKPATTVVTQHAVVDARAARWLVRTRAQAPISPTLNAKEGGDPVLAEALARWLSSALAARTVNMLLQHTDAHTP